MNSFYSDFEGSHPFEIFFESIEITDSDTLDLFDILASIYYTDIKRMRSKNLEKQTIKVQVRIHNVDLFNSILSELNELVNFMTPPEENWEFEFVQTEKKSKEQLIEESNLEFDNITLLSGGLDSFVGSFNNFKNGSSTLYVSYKNNVIEFSKYKSVKTFLKSIDNKCNFIEFSPNLGKKEHPTQRTRSLLYYGLAIVLAKINDISKINLYENGILSLNPNLNFSRDTTKTTHPRVISGLNEILQKINLNVQIIHPFLFLTKAQLLKIIDDDEFKKVIGKTYTCGMSRQNRKFDNSNNRHCGVCIPCLLRRISINAAGLTEFDVDYDFDFQEEDFQLHDLYSDFRSSVAYFELFNEYIKNKKIMLSLHLKSEYYTNENYFADTRLMLESFSLEIDNFINQIN